MSMALANEAAAAPALQFVPLTKHIGCEVRGVDLREPLAPAAASAVYRAWLEQRLSQTMRSPLRHTWV